jgi:hypothetical protein
VNLASYIDNIAEAVSSGVRLEDAIRSAAMRMKGLDPEDFQMRHRPPMDLESGAPLSRLYDIYPEDVYTQPRVYASTPEELDVAPIARRVRDRGDEIVDVFRATPRWVSDINPGEWVTPSYRYALRHADLIRRPDNPTVILAGKAPARNLLTEANSLAEFGLIGEPIRGAARSGAPRIPKTLVKQALSGNREALDRLAKLYGLDKIAGAE